MSFSERSNLRQKLEKAQQAIDAALLNSKAAMETEKASCHALINLQATVGDLLDELNREEESESVTKHS